MYAALIVLAWVLALAGTATLRRFPLLSNRLYLLAGMLAAGLLGWTLRGLSG